MQILLGAAGLGLDTLHRSLLSFGCFGGFSQVLLLLSEIKGSAIMGFWGWYLWTEPQLHVLRPHRHWGTRAASAAAANLCHILHPASAGSDFFSC